MLRRYKYPVLPLLNFILLMVIAVCSKEIIQDDPDNIKNFEKKYLKEGFISNNTYRVVIIFDKLNKPPDADTLKDTGIRRARISIHAYLRSEDRIIDSNVKAKVLNLINNYGKLSLKVTENQKSVVHYFDINKKDLKQYLEKIAYRRQ